MKDEDESILLVGGCPKVWDVVVIRGKG